MIFIKYKILFSVVLVLFLAALFSCSDNDVVNNGGNTILNIDPNILHTDSFGFILGGDTTDWCYRGNNEFSFNPAYPNPTYDTFKLNFTITVNDTVSLFFLNSNTDTAFILNNGSLQVGHYEVAVSSQALNYNSGTKRIFIKPKNNYNNSSMCRYFGDIQFY